LKKIAILQSNYIPWRGYFNIISNVDTFVIYDEVQYTKNDWRNRNKIKTQNGLIWLTIPVKQKLLDQKICESEVVDQSWRKKHLKTIEFNYSKAPHFKEFFPLIKSMYGGDEKFLSQINSKFIRDICLFLEIKTEIIDSRDLLLNGDKNERLVDACKKLYASTYLSGKAALNYLNLDLFKKNNIQIEWMDYSHLTEYPQLFHPFQNEVSIIDTILNKGKRDIFC
jgi:hypothetical protein